MKSAFDNLKII